jgi:hypothetical protein
VHATIEAAALPFTHPFSCAWRIPEERDPRLCTVGANGRTEFVEEVLRLEHRERLPECTQRAYIGN